ncbi:MmcQ/YjbR family DNA-binding protein [Cognatilysobacter lacus]|uniref:MmcQ/YjbR family DNA-binding protein n=1 Tax=Cognatilysobacter lacus TaxID=1643323 RepID=A0A5D8YNV3_9GAMM|nr:MmcQ/YjbR family DNA-binding protein [Lysobacter lacus]TZF83513.1 MmcQ/YjbR family DNA-binding protein [Lysobacter lacus]
MNVEFVRAVALALPEVTEVPHFEYGSFRVKGKIFVTVPPDDEHIHVFVDEQERLLAVAMYPKAVEPLPWGQKILGVRVNLSLAKPEMVEHLVRAAWRNKAPKRLVAAAGLSGPVA